MRPSHEEGLGHSERLQQFCGSDAARFGAQLHTEKGRFVDRGQHLQVAQQGAQVLAYLLSLAHDLDFMVFGGEHLVREPPEPSRIRVVQEDLPAGRHDGVLQRWLAVWHPRRGLEFQTAGQTRCQHRSNLLWLTRAGPVVVEFEVDVLALGLVAGGECQSVLQLGTR